MLTKETTGQLILCQGNCVMSVPQAHRGAEESYKVIKHTQKVENINREY